MDIRKTGTLVPALLSGCCLVLALACTKNRYAEPLISGIAPTNPGTGTVSYNVGTAVYPHLIYGVPVGTSVTITGSSFKNVWYVSFGGVVASTFETLSSSEVTAIVPENAVTGTVVVQNPAGLGTSTDSLIVLPDITGFAPTSGPVGTVVTVTGTGFSGASSIAFGSGDTTSTFTYNTPTRITAVVGAGVAAGAQPLTLTTAVLQVTNDAGETVETPVSFTTTATFTVTP